MNEGWTKKKIRASDCLDYAFTYARREFKTIIPVLLLFHVPFILIIRMLLNQTTLYMLLGDLVDDPFAVIGIVMMIMFGSFLSLLYYTVFRNVIDGALIYSAYRYTMFGDRPRLGRRIGRGFKVMLHKLLFGLIAGAVIFVILLLTDFAVVGIATSFLSGEVDERLYYAVIIGIIVFWLAIIGVLIYFLLRFAYMPQFVAIEDKNIFSALGASWKATKGKAGRLFCIYFVLILVSSGLSGAVTALQVLNLFASSFLISLFEAILAVFSSLGIFLGSIAVTFSYMHDIKETDILRSEMELAAYLKEREV